MLCALIMAGGKGERFWPLSTAEKPKQFLKLIDDKTMIQKTADRLITIIPIERIFVVTAERYVHLVKEQLPNIPERNIIVEPIGKNTAPCIALSALVISKYYDDPEIAVIPSDHIIMDEKKFTDILNIGSRFISENYDSIITLGITPNRPETGYGYIKYNEVKSTIHNIEIKSVERFVEKPNLNTAKEYVSNGNYLWNAGMFIWKASTILKLTKEHLNNTYQILSEIAASSNGEFNNILNEKYKEIESVSIDYGIMEKAPNIYVIPSDFGWDDVGNWTSVERYSEKDRMGNVIEGKVISIDTKNNIIKSTQKPIVAIGLEGLIIVDTKDALLVCSKNQEQLVKKALGIINE